MFKDIDTNGDLKIDLQEALSSLNLTQKNDATPEWFTDIDFNHDGSIDFTEFSTKFNDHWGTKTAHVHVSEYHILKMMLLKNSLAMPITLQNAAGFMATDTDGYLKNGTVPQWFMDLDTNHDGSLDTKEFELDFNGDGGTQSGYVSAYL